jgi:hypothetical protein
VTVAQRAPAIRASARTAWLAGALLGVPVGVLVLEGGIIGLVFLAVSGLLVARSRRVLAGFGGIATGLGVTWLALFGRVALTCRAEAGCSAPTIDTALIVSLAVAVIGLVCTVATIARSRRSSPAE